MDLGIVNVSAITAICYFVGMTWKISPLDDRWIPAVCGMAGAILGELAFVIGMPDFPATDIITASAVGIVSGLASTGINQLTKQFNKEDE